MRFVRWLLGIVAVLALALACLFLGARFADGPIAMVPGGPLRAGELIGAPVEDWSFAEGITEIELQLLEPARSRTVWVLVHEGRAYVPCSLDFPPFKSWHEEALLDGRALVRVQGRRYPVELVRVSEPPDLVAAIAERADAKYDTGPYIGPDSAWLFRLDPRAE